MAQTPTPTAPLIVAMKGHPGTGKTTLARAISAALRCPLLDKDDVRDCTFLLQTSTDIPPTLLNDLSYSVLWRLAETQLRHARLHAVVVDSPLSSRAHLDRVVEIAGKEGGRVVVVECRPGDEGEWRRRLEERAVADAAEGGGGWHKPATWEELRRLVDGYGGRADYDVGGVPRLVVDTTAAAADGGGGVEGVMETVMEFVKAHFLRSVN